MKSCFTDSRRWFRRLAASLGLLLAVAVLAPSSQASAENFMMRARVDGAMIEGEPISWNPSQVLLLGRDGRLHQFHPSEAKEAKKTSPRFFGYSSAEVKKELQREFGKGFDVSATKHYLVVHRAGERDQWAGRFEELYNRFTHYFRVRGFRTGEPDYPLVAIVFRDREEYYQYAASVGKPLQPNMLGHYDPISNRVFLYDVTANESGVDWSENAATIIHEATHQTAYNVGIHRRFAVTPRWLAEGLADMFEARGVWNARYDRTRSDRINHGRLNDFKNYVATRRQPGALLQLLSSDRAFQSDPQGAYAEAWALSFYLSETQPRNYATYLEKVARRPRFEAYSPTDRMADFQEIFGDEMKMFETKFLRYISELN